MLQYITHPMPGADAVAQALEAIEGGCRWIELAMPGSPADEVRRAAQELMPKCRETDCFLVIRGHVDLVDELRVSGVMLGRGDGRAVEVREKLGPHAVIGVEARTADDVLNMRHADIDYAVAGPWGEMTADDYRRLVGGVRAAGCTTPIVATGPIAVADIAAVMATGVSGVALAVDPYMVGEYLRALGAD